ncbi:MAG: hypothetical protein KAX37_01075 [Opitutaceae bacterium]|nr:hypothetical protein [Opitutaceae bacterium]
MKLLRILLVVVIALVVLLIIGVGVGLNSGFQTWLARRALSGQADMKAEVGRVSVGLNRIEVTSLRIARPGMVLELPSATVDVPVLKAAGRNVVIKRLIAHGWTLDLTAPDKLAGQSRGGRRGLAGYFAVLSSLNAAPASKSEAFKGIFGQLKFPVDLSVDGVDLEGEIIFPAEGGKSARAKIAFAGGQLASGREGKFTIQANAALSGAVSALDCKGELAVHMDTPSSIDRVAFTNNATAHGASVPNGAALQMDLKAEGDRSGGERYSLSLQSQGKSLMNVTAALPTGASKLDGKLILEARDSDLAPFSLGYPVPQFDARADATFRISTSFEQVMANGNLEISLSKLEVLQKELAPIGPLRIKADYSFENLGNVLRVNSLHANVDGDAPVAGIDVRQSFEYDMAKRELHVAEVGKELIALRLESIPMAWAQPFLGKTEVTGGQVKGVFVVNATAGGFSIGTQDPLTLSTFSIAQEGKPVVRDIAVSVAANASMAPQGWQAEISDFSLTSGTVALVRLAARAGQGAGEKQPVKATGSFALDLPAVLAQPAATGMARLTRGGLTGKFSASSGASHEVATQLTISDLASPEVKGELPKISVDLRASLDPEGAFVANVPMLVELQGRKSDVLLEAKGRTQKAAIEVDARLSSNEINVEDMKFLMAPFAGEKTASASGPVSGSDGAPPWSGISGTLSFALKRVIYSPELTVSDIDGALSIAETAITLKELKALLGPGGRMSASGGLTFSPSTAAPYQLKGDLAVTDLDSGATLKALNSGGGLPLVEGKFDIASDVSASGRNLSALMDHAAGDLRISSKGGLIRPVPANYVAAISAARAKLLTRTEEVGAIASLAGVLGAKLPGNLGRTTSKVHAIAERLGELEAIVKLIAELKFDQLTLDAGGSTTLDTVLRDFTITSPELRFVGSGGLKYQPNVPLWKQALSLKLNAAARGKAAEVMKKGNLLGGTKDGLGYIPLSLAVNIDGTAEKPDISQLLAVLFEKVLSMKLSPGDIRKLQKGDIGAILNMVSQLK